MFFPTQIPPKHEFLDDCDCGFEYAKGVFFCDKTDCPYFEK